MKHKIRFLIPCVVTVSMPVVSCRRAESDGSSNSKPVSTDSDGYKDGSIVADTTGPAETRPTRYREASEREALSNGIPSDHVQTIESAGQMLFSVPTSETAAADRKEAWEKLGTVSTGWSSVQYDYIGQLLDRHADSSPVDRLVMWKLCMVKMAYQAPPNKVIVGLGGVGSAREVALMKLNDALFSAIEEDSANLSYEEAVAKANTILDRAASD